MDKTYDPRSIEQRQYERWEANGWFEPSGKGAPYWQPRPADFAAPWPRDRSGGGHSALGAW